MRFEGEPMQVYPVRDDGGGARPQARERIHDLFSGSNPAVDAFVEEVLSYRIEKVSSEDNLGR
jgi:hypothetical protein